MNVGELFVSLGFDVDDKKLKEFNNGIKTTANELLKLAAIATGGVGAYDNFFGFLNRSIAIKNFQTETGQAAEGLQRFQSVVNQVNASISTQEAAGKYRALANAMTDISQQGGGGSLARLTGGAFHVGMKEEDVIEAIRNYKQQFINENGGGQIGIAAHARLLDAVGLGAGTERAFDMSGGQYRAMSDFAVRSQSSIESGTRLANMIALLNQKWQVFVDNLLANWAPTFIRWSDQIEKSFEKWLPILIKLTDQIGGLQTIGEIVLSYFAGKWMLGMLAAIFRVGAGFATLTVAAAPFLAVLGAPVAGFFAGKAAMEKSGAAQAIADFFVPLKNSSGPKISPAQMIRDVDKNGHTINVTQNVTAHVTSTADAKELVDNFMRQNQKALNTTLLSIIGQPAY